MLLHSVLFIIFQSKTFEESRKKFFETKVNKHQKDEEISF